MTERFVRFCSTERIVFLSGGNLFVNKGELQILQNVELGSEQLHACSVEGFPLLATDGTLAAAAKSVVFRRRSLGHQW